MFIKLVIRSWLLLAILDFVTTQDEPLKCKISGDIEGECILIDECAKAMELKLLNDRKTLQHLHCGYVGASPKVCCVTNRTDGPSITFKNTTQDITTDRPNIDLSSSVKVPPDPVATSPPTYPTESFTTKVYPTSTKRTTHAPKKKITNPNRDIASAGLFTAPILPPVAAAAGGAPSIVAVGASRFPTPTIPPVAPTSETLPTFDNPVEVDSVLPIKNTTREEPVYTIENIPTHPKNDIGTTTEQLDRVSSTQSFEDLLPNRNKCGQLSTSDKIFGGDIAGLDELPWIARIKYQLKQKETYACHAALISDRFLITAAHCLANGVKIIDVRLGDWDVETEIDCIGDDCNDPPKDVKVEKYYIHPTYNRRTRIGDIGILKLAEPVNFTEFVMPVCLPTTDYSARIDHDSDSQYLTGGWGKTEYETIPAIKRKIILNSVSLETCNATVRWPADRLNTIICAGGRKDIDTCSGDSGGPLTRLVNEGRGLNWVLYGVTSFGSTACGSEGRPSVYTRITYYMDWIKDVITRPQQDTNNDSLSN